MQEFASLDPEWKMDTVNAVVFYAKGRRSAATSTGGVTRKSVGRVGDSPFIGVGCYVNNTVAASCTSSGEMFMRLPIA